METGKIVKLLELSSSSHDGEALNAIRAANRILGKYDHNWEQFFKRNQEPEVRFIHVCEPEIEYARDVYRLFTMIFRYAIKRQNFKTDFVESLYYQFTRKGYLSEAQFEALGNIMEKFQIKE